nr:M23 family metallopeptidase [Sphingomonas aerophila]
MLFAGFASLTRFGGSLPLGRPSADPATTVRSDAAGGDLVVPVAGVARESLQRNWGDPREGGQRAHHGLDIMAPRMTPVLATAPGRVEKLFQSGLGGTTLYLRSADGSTVYYYAHLAGYAPGIAEGQQVSAGQPLGFVGDTGDAGAGNYHLHFGVQRMQPGQRWWQGEDVDPFPLLAPRVASR